MKASWKLFLTATPEQYVRKSDDDDDDDGDDLGSVK